jgi:hypothetical protein
MAFELVCGLLSFLCLSTRSSRALLFFADRRVPGSLLKETSETNNNQPQTSWGKLCNDWRAWWDGKSSYGPGHACKPPNK